MISPKLRFKADDGQEFPEWKTEFLGSYAETISSGKSNARKESGAYIFFGSTGVIGYADNFDYQGEKLLIARVGANAGYLYRVDGNYCVSDNTLMLTLNKPHNYSFFFNLLTKINLNKLVFGSGQPLITGGHLKNLDVAIPSLPEQTKIANFLTAVDEKISQLTQKHDLLTQYKKGLMQKIFSQELRFKNDGGREFPEWEEKLLGDLCVITTGKLDANAMVPNGEYRFYTCAREYYQIDKFAFDTDALLISGNGANVGYIHHYHGKFNAYQRTYVLDKFNENIIFIKYFLEEFLHQRIYKEAKEGNTPYIVMGTLTDMVIKLPTLQEQSKVANLLTAIDDKVTTTQAQLNAVKQYKQGLLQQMFV
jgi:type I restriction enzyme S subunit